jgi:hypothetical protein
VVTYFEREQALLALEEEGAAQPPSQSWRSRL